MNRLQQRAAASRKGRRSRLVMDRLARREREAKAAALAKCCPRTIGIVEAHALDQSSAVVAERFGCHPAYVRKLWARHGLEKRDSGIWPTVNASKKGFPDLGVDIGSDPSYIKSGS